jgi:monoamine oxidase
MARTQLFGRIQRAITKARAELPGAPPPGPRAISRRSALMLMAAAAACTQKSNAGPGTPGAVAIVGGGTSGLVIAWRLANAGVACEIFESSGRTGGRMYTLRNFTPEGHFCELGGELVDSNHEELIKLCGELGIPIQRLRAENSGASDIYDIGGKPYLDGDLLDPTAETGPFLPVAARIAADQAALLDANDNWTARGLELDALPLSQYIDSLASSTDRWVIDLLKLAYHGEYGIPVDQQSSLNLVDLIGTDEKSAYQMFGDSDEAHRIGGGSGTLPETLTERLTVAPLAERIRINLRHELANIAHDADGFRLTFKNEDKPPVERTFTRVVLALPFTRLREVKGLGGLGLSAEKMKAINELGYGVNAKLMVGTSSRPWEQQLLGINSPLTGTSYSDRGFQIVWDTSAGQEGEGGVITNFITGAPAKTDESAVLATLETSLKSFSPDMAAALTPKVRASFFWPLHPHTKASYSGALAGQYTSYFENAAKPELNNSMFFAGEHTSSKSMGFMNGAVEAGERAAREILAAG